MSTKDKVLLWLFGLCLVVIAPFVILLVISLLRYLDTIGWITTGFIILCFGCASLLMVSFTFSRIGLWGAKQRQARNSTNILIAGDIVIYRMPTGEIINLSAEKERARALASPIMEVTGTLESPREQFPVEDKTIIELYQKGIGDDTIYKSLRGKVPMSYIKKVIEEKG